MQAYLEADVVAALDRLAKRRRTARAALIREALRTLVSGEECRYGSILALAWIGRSGAKDVSRRHDDYLIADELERYRL